MSEAPQPDAEAKNGNVSISDSVVAKVAHNACREVPGVNALGGAASRALSSLRGESRTQGVAVDIHDDVVDIDLTIVATYGYNVTVVAEACRAAVQQQVSGTTGLKVRTVNVLVSDIFFPEEQPGATGGGE
jgi:uncharacterized alkaline shock family protein YloU